MKLIEALKQIKELKKKQEDLTQKVAKFCVVSNMDTPTYQDQKAQISAWMQAHKDISKEITVLKTRLAYTNLVTEVTVEINEQQVTKSIAEWIIRRRDCITPEQRMFQMIGDRGITEGMGRTPTGQEFRIEIIRYYDPVYRDKMLDTLAKEPSLIDARLEIANAVTDLLSVPLTEK